VKDIQVLCVGQVVTDIVAGPLTAFSFDKDTTRADSIELTNGGDAFNTAVDLVRLSVRTVLAGKIGGDSLGQLLLARAQDLGVGVEGLRVSAADSTSACIVLVNREGERVFIYHGGANESYSCEDLDVRLLRRAEVVHLGGVFDLPKLEGECMLNILRAAADSGGKTSMDVTWDNEGKWLERISSCLGAVDYFLPSLNEVGAMLGHRDAERAAGELLALGTGNVVIKLGHEGCYIANREERGFVAGCAVDRVVDTTGAGDAFVAGFLAGVVRGWPFRRCAGLGNAVGALAVQKVGATAGVTCFEDAAALMDRAEHQEQR